MPKLRWWLLAFFILYLMVDFVGPWMEEQRYNRVLNRKPAKMAKWSYCAGEAAYHHVPGWPLPYSWTEPGTGKKTYFATYGEWVHHCIDHIPSGTSVGNNTVIE